MNPEKQFQIPTWISPFSEPTTTFNNKAPSSHETSSITKRMKASGSPCPLDQIPIRCFKRCPFLRSYLLAICQEIWKTKHIPAPWTKAVYDSHQ